MVAKTGRFGLGACALSACLVCTILSFGQVLPSARNKSKANSLNSAVRELRSHLHETSVPAEEIAGPASRVFEALVRQEGREASGKEISWELRVVQGQAGKAFSLPDGAVYVDREMAQALGDQPGLWAAVLAHEIVHVAGHHWNKRATYRESLKGSSAGLAFLELQAFSAERNGSGSLEAEREVLALSRDLELEADADSLRLMARAGFHPDFATALYHWMEAQDEDSSAAGFLATHPGWNVREANSRKKYFVAIAEFEKFWPEAFRSPGGNAPALVFVGRPRMELSANRESAEIALPLRCENSRGSLDVVLLVQRSRTLNLPEAERSGEMRQTIGCASAPSTMSFVLSAIRPREAVGVEFHVLDDRGWLLARSQKLKFHY